MPNDLLSAELQAAMAKGEGRKNYMFDIAGDLGVLARAPSLTNLPNTLIVSAHGQPLSGFSPDKTATNDLANVIREKIKTGDQLSLEDIASRMGSATNEVKRAIINACYSAGYNFRTVKRLFPNLEELVSPTTEQPTSAAYLRNLTRPVPDPTTYHTKEISPFFKITPTQTNVIRKVVDLVPNPLAQKIETPLSDEEKRLDSLLSDRTNSVWTPQMYSSKAHLPSKEYRKRTQNIIEWQRAAFKKAKTREEFDRIDAQAQKMIDQLFENEPLP